MAEVFDAFLRANLAAGIAILIVAAARPVVRKWTEPRAAYRLWLAAPLCAVAAVLPRPEGNLAAPAGLETHPGLVLAWAVGALATLGLTLCAQYRFLAKASAGRAGPAMAGVICPRFVVPADYHSTFSAVEQDLIRLHERTHVRRGDLKVNAALVFARTICWFNPMIHLAARLIRLDQELACDAEVVRARPHARRLYAEAMLKAVTATAPPLGSAWATHPLEIRLRVMASKEAPPVSSNATHYATCVALLGVALASWCAQPLAPAERRHPSAPPIAMTLRLSEAPAPAGLLP